MKKLTMTSCIGFCLCFGYTVAQTLADTTQTNTKTHYADMNCKNFVELTEKDQPLVVAWLDGFYREGKKAEPIYDISVIEKIVPILVEDCATAPEHPLYDKIKNAFKKVL